MPTTITSYTSFVSGTKAKAEQVNANFSNHRGTLLPIFENTASASDEDYNIGASDYRWVNAFFRTWQFKSTSTYESLSKAYQDTSGNFNFDLPTATEYRFKIGNSTKFVMTDSGTSSQYIKTRFKGETGGSVVINGATTTFQGFTVPSTFDHTSSTFMAIIDRDTSFNHAYLATKNGRFQVDLMGDAGTIATTWYGRNTTTAHDYYYQHPGFIHIETLSNTITNNFYLQFTKVTGTAWQLIFRGNLKIQELI